MAVIPIIGRDRELDAVRAVLAEPATQGVVLRGEPGVGKTVLWQAGVDAATARGGTVLAHRAVEAEAALGFTGLADLVAPVLGDVADGVAPPRLRALRVALLLEESGAEPPLTQAIGLAVCDVLRSLAVRRPVLLAIDDLQWLDSSTASVLPLALRRLRGERVGLLASVRDAPGVRAAFDAARVLGESAVSELTIEGLDEHSLHRLLADRLEIELSRPQLAQIHRMTRGNPLFALELARSGGTRLPPSLREALDERLLRLPRRTSEVLLRSAALTRPTVAAVAGDDAAREALAVALDARVVELDGEVVRFAHPLLASRCYELATPWRRRDVHRILAGEVADTEQHARHLALASEAPDEAVAAKLDAAVAHAAGRGATAAAAELADLAVGQSPGPAAARRFAAAHFHHLAGDFGRASAIYTALADELQPGVQRADALYLRALIGRETLPERARLCDEALGDAAGDDARCADIHGFQAINRWLLGSVPAGVREARTAVAHAERAGDPRSLPIALGRLALMEAWGLDETPGLLERGVELESRLERPLLFVESPRFIRAVLLAQFGEFTRSREMFHGVLARAGERGDEHTRQWALLQLTNLEWFAGRLHDARAHAVESRELAEQTGEPQFAGMVASATARVEADLGLLAAARATARRGRDVATQIGDEIHQIGNLLALGRAELVAGDPRAAAMHLRGVPERQVRCGNLTILCDGWADTIEALAALGELDAAQEHLDRYRALPMIRYRWAGQGAARAEGLLHAARGDRDAALAVLSAAVAGDDPPVYPIEHGRTMLALGTVQRQDKQRRAARDTLRRTEELFESRGAAPWAAKARAELARIGGRTGSRDALTPVERAVVRHVVDGRQNKEVAAAMFITVRTVESHLTRIYRKLGVRSRTELAARLAGERDTEPPVERVQS